MTWIDGYISDVAYPAFFYKELQPRWLAAVAGFLGLRGPDPDLPFAMCELGCGVGTNLLVAAACHPQARFTGVDAGEAHIRAAQDAAAAAGLDNVAFIQSDFATFAQEPGDGFDLMTCHGVWSWIAPHHRAALLDGVAARLKPDGLFLLHYMCHPGSTDLLPFQHLLNLCAHHLPGPSANRARTGLKLLRQLAARGLYADRPGMLRHLARLEERDPADLAHEFLTDHWHPAHSADLHQQAGRSGLCFVGSAEVFNNLDLSLSVPGRLQPLIRDTAAPALAETLKDMARNAHQRVDLFGKRPAATPRDDPDSHDAQMFALLPGAPGRGPMDFATPIGTVTGSDTIFAPLLRRLADGPATMADLARLPPFAEDRRALLVALQLLMMQGVAHPAGCQPPAPDDRVPRLQRWFDRNRVALRIVEPCGTAVTTAMPAAPLPHSQ